MVPLILRPARPDESSLLGDLAFAAKAHWGYPPELMALWVDDLGVSPGFIEHNHVICAERGGEKESTKRPGRFLPVLVLDIGRAGEAPASSDGDDRA
jgi:hypothetical protein